MSYNLLSSPTRLPSYTIFKAPHTIFHASSICFVQQLAKVRLIQDAHQLVCGVATAFAPPASRMAAAVFMQQMPRCLNDDSKRDTSSHNIAFVCRNVCVHLSEKALSSGTTIIPLCCVYECEEHVHRLKSYRSVTLSVAATQHREGQLSWDIVRQLRGIVQQPAADLACQRLQKQAMRRKTGKYVYECMRVQLFSSEQIRQ